MDFILKEYHRNISDQDFIDDMHHVANILNRNSISSTDYQKYGKYNISTIVRRFGSWNKALESAKMEIQKNCVKNEHNHHVSNEELLDDLISVANKLGKQKINSSEYKHHGKHGISIFQSRFGTWEKALDLAGLSVAHRHNFSDEDLLSEIERIWMLLGRQPTTTDIKSGLSKYSLQSYSRRFGGWVGALQAFIEWVNTDNNGQNQAIEEKTVDEVDIIRESPPPRKTHNTSRDVNLRLRFRVMQRDSFKCCMCGASPAKDPSVVLHIDHIVPWSRGGETTIDNLQTLCSKCNLGKSDL